MTGYRCGVTGNHSDLPKLPLRLSPLQILGLQDPDEGDWGRLRALQHGKLHQVVLTRAVAHAVASAPAEQLVHITGPDVPLPERGTVTVIGPGTGLGVAHFHRFPGGYHVTSTEGGHIEFAPLDAIDDWMLARLRGQHLRVSTERVHSGPGIVEIYQALAAHEHRPAEPLDDRTIWERGIAREDALAAAAVDRFCHSLGSLVGDYALAHGASAVVLAGGIGFKLRELLPRSAFGDRFRFKGRYTQMMAGIPVKLIVHPQPGLYGAAAAFQLEHLR